MKIGLMIGAAALSIAASAPAQASTYSDALTRCLTQKTTLSDSGVLVRWVFAGMALSPVVRSMTNVTEAQRDALTREAGKLFERLLTVDCRAETVEAMKHDGMEVIQVSFGALGEHAMGVIIQDPQVLAAFAGAIRYVDMNKLTALVLEAGPAVLPKVK
jgi:hypothetical protein